MGCAFFLLDMVTMGFRGSRAALRSTNIARVMKHPRRDEMSFWNPFVVETAWEPNISTRCSRLNLINFLSGTVAFSS